MPNRLDSFEQAFSFHWTYINPSAWWGIFAFRRRDVTSLKVIVMQFIPRSNPEIVTLVCLDVLCNGRAFSMFTAAVDFPHPYKKKNTLWVKKFLNIWHGVLFSLVLMQFVRLPSAFPLEKNQFLFHTANYMLPISYSLHLYYSRRSWIVKSRKTVLFSVYYLVAWNSKCAEGPVVCCPKNVSSE